MGQKALLIYSYRLLKLRNNGDEVFRGDRGMKTMFPCQFSIKLPRKRTFLTVQGDFDEIIDTDRSELCFLTV